MERSVWSFDRSTLGDQWDDSTISVSVAAGHVLIEVSEEHAMDSYNEWFSNSIKLPYAQVRELAALLQSALANTQ